MSRGKHGRGVQQAWQMLDAFASVGAYAFDLTQTGLDGDKRSFCPAVSLETLRRRMPGLMELAARRQHNLILRPRCISSELVQLDDLSAAMLERVSSSAFLLLATSAGNHQAWLAVRECTPDFARRLRQGSDADPSASGATRIAGSVNFKRKYAPDFPVIRIVETTLNRTTTRTALEALGLVAAAAAHSPVLPPGRVSFPRARQWPSYERCLRNAPLAHHSDRPDVSRADFTFCLLALDWGWSIADTCQRLLQCSGKARANGKVYASLTTERAAAALDRRKGHLAQGKLQVS